MEKNMHKIAVMFVPTSEMGKSFVFGFVLVSSVILKFFVSETMNKCQVGPID